ncbi:MAG: tRNA lysidine(34) synthetase TilS [Gammaproteobacteria bacterium]|nr:tRNA lysidine(34) synthetase TilS [Gammaproteobacteria bacterium]
MSFNPDHLLQQLVQLSAVSRYWVAFSGGCDSHVLLHSLVAIREQLDKSVHAIHINHGLQAVASSWEVHCQQVCDALSVPLEIVRVDARPETGESPEARARQARYQVFKEILQDEDVLLIAHHEDDQAETLMIQLLRGAGVKGLAAMPVEAPLGKGRLYRPLLGVTRAVLQQYAKTQGLVWIDDPSNQDTRFDRNYLRHEIMPLLHQRWPAVTSTLSRSAENMAESAELLRQLAREDFANIKQTSSRVNVEKLLGLEAPRLRNLLRYWLSEICQLTTPDRRHLNRIVHEVLPAAEDASPVVSWMGGEVRRFRGELYAMQPQPQSNNEKPTIPWDGKQALKLDKQVLIPHQVKGQGVNPDLLARHKLSIRFRHGGEKCKPVGRGHHHSLKKLFQEWGIPPWQREQVPLLYVGEEIAQIIGYCICEPFQSQPQQDGLLVTLENETGH